MMRTLVFLLVMGIYSHSAYPKPIQDESHEPIYIHGENGIEIDRLQQEIRAFKNAYVKRGSSILYGDVIYGYYAQDTRGKPVLSKVQAFRNVKVQMPDKVLRAREGVYNVTSDIIFFRGDVRITEKNNHLKGDYAKMDRKTGHTIILNYDPEKKPINPIKGSRSQVRVLLGR